LATREAGGMDDRPRVGIIMGSRSDLETMQAAATTLRELGIAHEMRVVSAHRTPDLLYRYAEGAAARGLRVLIAGAGGAAHLPGMTAAKTNLPVIGVPVRGKTLDGLDSLLSIVQMPPGVPVATMAIGNAANAALFAARILALEDPALAERLAERVAKTAAEIEAIDL
jgi:5-(carboxyamino)imidazole ribonucleotide mutase